MNDGTPLDGTTLARIDPNLLVILKELDDKRNAENLRNAAVTVEDLDDAQPQSAPEEETDRDEN